MGQPPEEQYEDVLYHSIRAFNGLTRTIPRLLQRSNVPPETARTLAHVRVRARDAFEILSLDSDVDGPLSRDQLLDLMDTFDTIGTTLDKSLDLPIWEMMESMSLLRRIGGDEVVELAMERALERMGWGDDFYRSDVLGYADKQRNADG